MFEAIPTDFEPEREQRYPRRFYLYRGKDETGVSGTGVVADGVVWQDGSVTLKWLGPHSSEVSWKSMEHVEAVHGHNGRTVPIWRDDEEGRPFHAQTPCPYESGLQRGIADVEAGRVKPVDRKHLDEPIESGTSEEISW